MESRSGQGPKQAAGIFSRWPFFVRAHVSNNETRLRENSHAKMRAARILPLRAEAPPGRRERWWRCRLGIGSGVRLTSAAGIQDAGLMFFGLRFRSGCTLVWSILCCTAAVSSATDAFDPPALYLTWQHDPTSTLTVQWLTVDT